MSLLRVPEELHWKVPEKQQTPSKYSQISAAEATTQTDDSSYLTKQTCFPGNMPPASSDSALLSNMYGVQMPSQEPFNHMHSYPVLGSIFNQPNGNTDAGGTDTSNIDQPGRSSPVRTKLMLSSYLAAMRPWSFTVSIIPVALGSCLAYKSKGVFDISIFLATVFTAICVHAAGNLVNTYCDFKRGIDNKKSDDRTLVDNILAPNDVVSLGAVFYICGCAGFLLLNFLSLAKMEHLALIYFCGLSSSFFYTGGLGLKYIALGDIVIILTFGPVTVVYSYLSQTGQLSLVPLVYAVPLALNTEAILHSNNSRDMEADRQAGMLTLAILLGQGGSYGLFCCLLFIPYLMFIIVGIHYSPWMLLPAMSILLAFPLEKSFRKGSLETLPHEVARLNLIMGVLYIVAVILTDPQTLPTLTPLAS